MGLGRTGLISKLESGSNIYMQPPSLMRQRATPCRCPPSPLQPPLPLMPASAGLICARPCLPLVLPPVVPALAAPGALPAPPSPFAPPHSSAAPPPTAACCSCPSCTLMRVVTFRFDHLQLFTYIFFHPIADAGVSLLQAARSRRRGRDTGCEPELACKTTVQGCSSSGDGCGVQDLSLLAILGLVTAL